MLPDHRHRAQLSSHLLRVLVRLNGCVAYDALDAGARVLERSLVPWLRQGANRLEALLAPLPPVEEEEPSFSLSLHRVETGGRAWDGNLLVAYEWTDDESVLDAYGLRRVFDHTFTVEPRFGAWAWTSAAPFAPDDAPGVLGVVQALHAALARRDLATVMATLRSKHAELDLGLEEEPGSVEQAYFARLSEIWEAPDAHLEPLSSLHIETTAEGRLVHVRGRNDEPPIVLRGGGHVLGLSPTLSRVDNHYRIVR